MSPTAILDVILSAAIFGLYIGLLLAFFGSRN